MKLAVLLVMMVCVAMVTHVYAYIHFFGREDTLGDPLSFFGKRGGKEADKRGGDFSKETEAGVRLYSLLHK